MFNPLTRTLKLGLTAITILTAGVGVAFAQTATPTAPALPTVVVHDIVDYCSGDGRFRNPSLCTNRINQCIYDPFYSVERSRYYSLLTCAEALGESSLTVAKVRYCSKATNRTKPGCTEAETGKKSIVDSPNAANWAKQNPDVGTMLDHYRGGKFVKGTAAGLDLTNFIRDYYKPIGSLYFNTATFNGKPLGGDATDGVAFLNNGHYIYYAGILSGTDLGAPVTQTSGVASWVGRFQLVQASGAYTTNKDFVLEIAFGSVAGVAGSVGSVKAFVKSDDRGWGYKHFNLEGTFDNTGLIEGTVQRRDFINNDRKNPAPISNTSDAVIGTLTGLIGQDGAVGAFASIWYGGGFVARPVNLVPGLATTFIADTCTGPDGDPFHEFCHIGDVGKVAMDEERSLRVAECIHGGNASDDNLCENAIERNPCILNPFDIACVTNDKFATHHVAARANRIAFCNDANNAQNDLCTGDNLVNVCGYDPFASICFGSDAASVTGLPEKRTAKNKECGAHSSANDPSCAGVLGRASSASFLQSFETELNTDAARVNLRNEFLKGLDTLADAQRTYGYRDDPIKGRRPFVSITLASVREDRLSLSGEVADGVAFFGSTYNNRWGYHAGILSTTDLGKPLTVATAPTGEWKGIFQTTGPSRFKVKEDFTLTVTFTAGQDHVGEVDAFVASSYSTEYYHLTGKFDDNGIIKGDVDFGSFRSDESGNADSGKKGTGTRYPGRLQGLIGEQGAVGAFISGTTNSASGNYAGGFVASPFAVPTVQFSDWVNSFGDALLTSPSTGGSATNQFLKGGETELSSIGVTGVVRNSLNLADATFGGNPLGGNSVNGVAFFRGTHSVGRHYYAGILSGTDLGGPVTQKYGSAHWNGSLQIVHSDTANRQSSAVDFTLTVNFGGTGDRAGSISSTFRWAPSIPYWMLSGHFDTNGVITGNIAKGSSTIGNVTGLIGQQGAVGAFHASNNSGYVYSGGFVACPYDSVNNRCQQ